MGTLLHHPSYIHILTHAHVCTNVNGGGGGGGGGKHDLPDKLFTMCRL